MVEDTARPFVDPLEMAVEATRAGQMTIIVDDDDRENEGDLVVATEHVTAEQVAFMLREGRGLVCVSLGQAIAKRIGLCAQESANNSRYQTPFVNTLDHRSVRDCGVTARGRAATMRALVDSEAVAGDFVSPGATVPLVAHAAGVLGRRGQTEGSHDLARLAGLKPSGVICEILDASGSVIRGAALRHFADTHRIPITSVDAIARYRIANEIRVRRLHTEEITTAWGVWQAITYRDEADRRNHIAMLYGTPSRHDALCRIHSECLTGDVFGSRRCDCGPQLDAAMRAIVERGAGVLVYLRQEGRGIGLLNKLRAYELQDVGADTVEANERLGLPVDARDFAVAAAILSDLGVNGVQVMTNNPNKVSALRRHGVSVERVLPSVAGVNDRETVRYLSTKRDRLGHQIPNLPT